MLQRTPESQSSTRPSRIEVGTVLVEAALIGVAGLVFAFTANWLSPRGLALSRDYFPGATRPALPAAAVTNMARSTAGTTTNIVTLEELLAARLKARGLELVDSNRVERLFRDPAYEQELIVFVDARDDQRYQDGHVPRAYQLDHYRAENYLGTVLPVCQTADQIVVYCNGGGCEDSEFAAVILGNAGIPMTRLSVYGGGLWEWATNGLPIEIGERNSGNLRKPSP